MPFFRYYPTRCALPLVFAALFAGCEKKEVRVYLEPKEAEAPAETASADHDHDHSDPNHAHEGDGAKEQSGPALTWKQPPSWKSIGGDQMNLARFQAGTVSINITPFGDLKGREVEVVNLWRSQFKQEPLGEPEALKLLKPITVAGEEGKLFDYTAEHSGEGGTKVRMAVAIVHHQGGSWFFKLQGTPEAVEGEFANFREFLGSMQFVEAPPETAPAPGTPAVAPQIPPGWTSVSPGAMQVAKFNVPPKDGTTAEVTVSIFPNDTGGAAANIRRWRGQLGMADTDDATILAGTKPLSGAPAGALVVDLENAGKALTGAIVPRGGEWYFYKLMGGTAAVAAARESFMVFIQTP